MQSHLVTGRHEEVALNAFASSYTKMRTRFTHYALDPTTSTADLLRSHPTFFDKCTSAAQSVTS